MDEILRRELRTVPAPPEMWWRVEAALTEVNQTRVLRAWFKMSWVYASGAIAILLVSGVWLQHTVANSRALDLDAYMEPVINPSDAANFVAIDQTPSHFQPVTGSNGPVSVGGYTVAARRVLEVKGEPVQQLILTAAGSAVALFIASPRVRFHAGRNQWVEDSSEGAGYKRLSSVGLRTVLFPCSKEMCVLVCKTCSTQAFRALMGQVAASPVEFR